MQLPKVGDGRMMHKGCLGGQRLVAMTLVRWHSRVLHPGTAFAGFPSNV
jgi:hypothetical protein